MNFLSRLKKELRGEKKEKRKLNDLKEKSYEDIQAEKEREWRKQFKEYTHFSIVQKGIRYTISANFKEEENRKEEIAEFLKQALEANMNLQMILINIALIYNLGTGIRGVKSENKISLFFS